MSKLARTLVLGAMLAAMNLAGMTAVAQAQANDEGKDARPPTEGQVGESWRKRPVTLAAADRRGRRPPAATGPGALLPLQRDARPGARPDAGS